MPSGLSVVGYIVCITVDCSDLYSLAGHIYGEVPYIIDYIYVPALHVM